MIREDFYTGQPVQNEVDIAAEQANFGAYSYAAGSRPPMTPGGYGYSTSPNPNFMNPPQSPYPDSPFNQPYPQQPMYQPQPYGGMGQYNPWPNPVFNSYQYQQQPAYQATRYITVKGYNPGGNEYLPPLNAEEIYDDMFHRLINRQIESEVNREIEAERNGYAMNYNMNAYGYNYNYFGVPYLNYSSNNYMDIQAEIDAAQEEARKSRIEFNKNLSRLAHNYVRHPISEEMLSDIYEDKVVEVPQSVDKDLKQMQFEYRVSQMVPFDNSEYYRQREAQLKAEHDAIIPPDSDMKTAFKNMGVLWAKFELEEERHRRRNMSSLYNSTDNSYRNFVRQKAKERILNREGHLSVEQVARFANVFDGQQAKKDLINQFSTLKDSAQLSDDGTLTISCNFGSHKGETYTVHNAMESAYEQDEQRFHEFLNSIPGYTDIVANGGGSG